MPKIDDERIWKTRNILCIFYLSFFNLLESPKKSYFGNQFTVLIKLLYHWMKRGVCWTYTKILCTFAKKRWEWVLQKYMLCTNMLRSRPMIWRNKKNIRMNDIYCHLLLSSLLLSLLSLLLDFSIVNWVTSLCFKQIETIHILWIHK